jgi:hypothetical protein
MVSPFKKLSTNKWKNNDGIKTTLFPPAGELMDLGNGR